jgi:hypothetical protein
LTAPVLKFSLAIFLCWRDWLEAICNPKYSDDVEI